MRGLARQISFNVPEWKEIMRAVYHMVHAYDRLVEGRSKRLGRVHTYRQTSQHALGNMNSGITLSSEKHTWTSRECNTVDIIDVYMCFI